MPKKGKEPVEVVEDEEENELHMALSRTSKFKEGTMNSTASIVAPPAELWKGLAMDDMIERFHEESASAPAFSAATPAGTTTRKRPAVSRATSGASVAQTPGARNRTPDAGSAPVPASEGPFTRFSRAVSSWFNGATFSALGKRKAGSETAERRVEKNAVADKPADVKELEERYRQMKEQGMFKPTVTTGPRTIPRTRQSNGIAGSAPTTPTPNLLAYTPGTRTPGLYKTPSKRDMHKQKKLTKRVSDLEHKLHEARRELSLALGPDNPNPVPPLPALPPADLPPTPKTDPSFSASEPSPPDVPSTTSKMEKMGIGKVVKKRKALREGDDDADFKPIPTESDTDTNANYSHASESEGPSTKRTKITPPKKLVKNKSARRMRKQSVVRMETEQIVTVVPDGVAVPDVPHIPQDVNGKRVPVSPGDGYGGLEHEMF